MAALPADAVTLTYNDIDENACIKLASVLPPRCIAITFDSHDLGPRTLIALLDLLRDDRLSRIDLVPWHSMSLRWDRLAEAIASYPSITKFNAMELRAPRVADYLQANLDAVHARFIVAAVSNSSLTSLVVRNTKEQSALAIEAFAKLKERATRLKVTVVVGMVLGHKLQNRHADFTLAIGNETPQSWLRLPINVWHSPQLSSVKVGYDRDGPEEAAIADAGFALVARAAWSAERLELDASGGNLYIPCVNQLITELGKEGLPRLQRLD